MVPIPPRGGGNHRRAVAASASAASSSFLLLLGFFGKACLDLGIFLGTQYSNNSNHSHSSNHIHRPVRPALDDAAVAAAAAAAAAAAPSPHHGEPQSSTTSKSKSPTYPPFSNLVVGAALVKRNDLMTIVDFGVPIDPDVHLLDPKSDDDADVVTILFTSSESLPDQYNNSSERALLTAHEAIENCRTLKVVFTEHHHPSNCLAVVGHSHESLHVHRFHRFPNFRTLKEARGLKADKNLPFRSVPRSVETGGTVRVHKELRGELMFQYLDELVMYLRHLRQTLDALRPIAKAAAAAAKDGTTTVVAMTVNHGQFDLFMNFVCSARSRGLDLSNVVLFATDEKSAQLAKAMGIHVFEVQDAFGSGATALPTHAATSYGDRTFGRMVMAKVYSVHLLVLLGYDVLLQDVDVVWHRNPIEYFTRPELDDFDLVFQDDGSREARFAPYFANTGLYYVRNNRRTIDFFNHVVRMGDVVKTLKCDQSAAAIFLSESMSRNGLRIKVLGRDSPEGRLFLGGFHFHRRPDDMRKLVLVRQEDDDGDVEEMPYMFHMSWSRNATMKQQFLSQMGQWFVKSDGACNGTAIQGVGSVPASSQAKCCAAEPVVQCHYRDRPSVRDCRDAEGLLVRGGTPFWPIDDNDESSAPT